MSEKIGVILFTILTFLGVYHENYTDAKFAFLGLLFFVNSLSNRDRLDYLKKVNLYCLDKIAELEKKAD